MAQLGGAVVCGTNLCLGAEHAFDPNKIAILNDTHIGGAHPANAPIPTHLRDTVAWLLRQDRYPAAVIINGDLALSDGRPADYKHLTRLVEPLHQAGIPIHLTLGNHDDRDVFYKVLKEEKRPDATVVSRHVGMVSLPLANLFLLDSLKAPMVAQGLLGAEQLAWLGRMLDEHFDKPALILAHHNPRLGDDEKHFPGGLEDTEALWNLLASRTHVKAYIHGHIHHRDYSQHRGIHIVNTPATSFVLRPEVSTTGWTMAQLTENGAEFMTLTHLRDHPWDGAVRKLEWRSA
ncbi:hypothetical protein BGE01nite_03530 [Brevifollis gellanilyticus]|uniref:Calcineurin-like phosphoesterase domain-containing protein n=2 Tax=Brevifollis gellanilyticus TaxID=748831 RepID=A0A512M2V1_9BACT|nr:hypothetical protein BGE01nite_03530 [Brevifollis gellanilyticus]